MEQRMCDVVACDEANVERAFRVLEAFVERIERPSAVEVVELQLELVQRVTARVGGQQQLRQGRPFRGTTPRGDAADTLIGSESG